MAQQIFLRLLILCVLSEGFASLSNTKSSDLLELLVRKKRLIDKTVNANPRVRRLRDANYVVDVHQHDFHTCAGSILSAHVIVTLGSCVNEPATYFIRSGTTSRTGGTIHDVHGILIHPHFDPEMYANNVALVSIQQPITFGRNIHQPISIYNSNNGILPPHAVVTVSGWGLAVRQQNGGIGCVNPFRERPFDYYFPNTLRSISLNTIDTNECRARNGNDPQITDELICSFHQQKFCGAGDEGDPLVFQNHLAGILLSDGFHRGPDIYVNVARPLLRSWIYENMDHIPEYAPHPFIPSPPRSPPRPHNRRQPQTCSQVHPCDSD